MLAAIVRVEGLLARKGIACEEELNAMRSLCGLGLPVYAASESDGILEGELRSIGASRVSARSLGAKPFSAEGLQAIAAQIRLPARCIYAISRKPLDIATATLAGMPTIIIGTTARSPRAVATLADAVERIREPYGVAALELRAIFASAFFKAQSEHEEE